MSWSVDRSTKKSATMTGTAIDASGSNSSSNLRLGRFNTASIQIVHSSHSDTSTWAVQESIDNGTTWDTILDSSTTTSGASGSYTLHITDLVGDMIRITVTETDANGSATLTPYVKLWAR